MKRAATVWADHGLTEVVARTARRIAAREPACRTEEATKHALVLPVLEEVLGWNPRDPREVVPEFGAAFEGRRPDRCDYGLLVGGRPMVLVEAKAAGTRLPPARGQLQGYFAAAAQKGAGCRTAILTNGTEWEFYADLKDRNRLDAEPCFRFDFRDYRTQDVRDLRIAHREHAGTRAGLARMEALQDAGEVRRWLERQARCPDAAFVSFLAGQTGSGSRRAARRANVETELKAALAERPGKTQETEPRQLTLVPPGPGRRLNGSRNGSLTVRLDEYRWSTAERGWTGTRVMCAVLGLLWKNRAGREAIEAAARNERGLRAAAEDFGKSRRPVQTGSGGPWFPGNASHAERVRILSAVRCEMPGWRRMECGIEQRRTGN